MAKLRNIKGIFLDLGGTLLYPPSGSFMFSDLAKRYFAPEKLRALPLEQVKAAKERAERERSAQRGRPVLAIEEEHAIFLRYYTVLSSELGLGLTDAELKAVADDKVYNDNYRLFDDTLETLKALHGKYRLGLISDTWPSIVPQLEHFDVLKYFDCATFSYELGALKPDPRMYRDALDKMGLAPQETVFVDDNLHNLLGAAELGMHTVRISAEGWSPSLDRIFGIDSLQAAGQTASPPPNGKEPPHIGRISQLLELLD